jgi:hypothetical protein
VDDLAPSSGQGAKSMAHVSVRSGIVGAGTSGIAGFPEQKAPEQGDGRRGGRLGAAFSFAEIAPARVRSRKWPDPPRMSEADVR